MENPEIVTAKRTTEPTSLPTQSAPAPDAPQPEQGEDSAAPAESAAQGKALPNDLLRIPAIQGLVAGAPGAISAPIKEFAQRGEAKTIIQHKALLEKAGMGFYKALDGVTGVIFNQLYVHGDQLAQADQAGQLLKVAPSFDMVNHQLATAGAAHPALNHPGVPAAPAAAPIPVPPQSAGSPQAQAAPTGGAASPPAQSAAAQRDLMTARVNNLQPGSPTSGAVPGAGRLLNQVLKPVL
jgi:hypothetical protein